MQSQLLFNETPSRQLCIQPRVSGTKKPSYTLLLEKLGSPQQASSSGNINCTAKFVPANSFDTSMFKPMIQQPIYGCLGLIQVNNEPFVCVVTDCTPVGLVEESAIYTINNVMFFSLTSNKFDDVADNGSSFVQQRENVGTPGYGAAFSSDYGSQEQQFETVRHPCQHLVCGYALKGWLIVATVFVKSAQKRHQADYGGIWEVSDNRFFWNENMIRELLKFRRQLPDNDRVNLDNEGILVMAISGFVRIEDVQIFRETIKCGIISRLSCRRAGTRFNTRGVDDDGHVANNVETELLVYHNDLCYSVVIVRGSVPVFWEQQGIQLGGHRIQISRSAAATQPAVERHFNDMLNQYGQVHVVNLLSQKEGAESLLTDAFSQHVSNFGSNMISQTNFDFHAAVKGNQFDNLGMLIGQLREQIRSFGFFLINMKVNKVISNQQGVFRVNCLDCLDRTNVVEGLICKASLNVFLQTVKLSSDTLYNGGLNDLWADNGDELSRIYTGTGALKSGFTRTGKRTIAGFMDDARKSAARFYMNNFQDKAKQEMIDHLLGKLPNQPVIRLFNPVREAVKKALEQRKGEFSSSKFIRIHIGTWNVNGKQPLGESLLSWLSFASIQKPEIFVIGFQEIVELSPQQIMATDMTKRLVWEDLILKTLNVDPTNGYVVVKSGQLVGAALIVIVRADCVANLRNVQGSIKKTGLAGLAGNKGGVAIRMEYNDTTVCFVCAHLAAGQSNVADRNTDYRTINDGLVFEKGLKIDSHDVVFWLGDFNYRVELENDQCRHLAESKKIDQLLPYDQLLAEMKYNRVFPGFSEARITFPPTYKYDAGTNSYDSSEKNRTPSWTDRILFSGQGLEVEKYERSELVSSDHKPVKALIRMEVRVLNKEVQEKIQQQLYQQYAGLALTTTITSPTPPTSSLQYIAKPQGMTRTPTVGKLIDFDDVPVQAPQLPPRPTGSQDPFWPSAAPQQVRQPAKPAGIDPWGSTTNTANPFDDFAAISFQNAPTQKQSQANPFIDDPFKDPWK